MDFEQETWEDRCKYASGERKGSWGRWTWIPFVQSPARRPFWSQKVLLFGHYVQLRRISLKTKDEGVWMVYPEEYVFLSNDWFWMTPQWITNTNFSEAAVKRNFLSGTNVLKGHDIAIQFLMMLVKNPASISHDVAHQSCVDSSWIYPWIERTKKFQQSFFVEKQLLQLKKNWLQKKAKN